MFEWIVQLIRKGTYYQSLIQARLAKSGKLSLPDVIVTPLLAMCPLYGSLHLRHKIVPSSFLDQMGERTALHCLHT